MEVLPLILTISSVRCLPTSSCNRLKIGERFYDREVLWSNLGRPYNLNVHKRTHTLFFSYSVPETYSDTDFQLAYYDLDTKDYNTIPGIRGGCAIAVDNTNDDIYMGGSDGIYKYNMQTKIADLYKEKGKNIWSVFFRHNLFYITYPEQKLYMELDGEFSPVREFNDFEVDHFHVTNKGIIYFANKTGLYEYNNENKKINVVNELVNVRQIVEDVEDNVYIVTNYGIYLLKGELDEMKKIVSQKNIFGLTFDKDNNFVISDDRSIILLNSSNETCEEKEQHW